MDGSHLLIRATQARTRKRAQGIPSSMEGLEKGPFQSPNTLMANVQLLVVKKYRDKE